MNLRGGPWSEDEGLRSALDGVNSEKGSRSESFCGFKRVRANCVDLLFVFVDDGDGADVK